MLKILVFICHVILLIPAAGQHLSFRQYQVENGLSHNMIRCSIQDAKGFLWFGTLDGLNRFDGYTFKVYRNDRKDRCSIGCNNIKSLCTDTGDKLWVGTEKGLYHYDPETESFELLATDSMAIVSDMQMDQRGVLWFILGYTLHRYDTRTGKLFAYPAKKYFKATSLCFAGDQLWVSSSEGVLEKYHAAADSFTSFDLFKGVVVADKNKWIDQLYAASDGNLLVGTATHGAKIFFTEKEQFADILTYNEDKTGVFVKRFIEVNKGEYWIGTESSGIYIYHSHTGKLCHVEKRHNDPYALSDNSINTFSRDTEGGIWVGTNYGGVNYYAAKYDVFRKYFPRNGENSLVGNVVREIRGDHRGNLWIGTEDAGLSKLELATGRFTNYQPDGSSGSISYKNIHGMLVDGDDLWIGTYVHGLDVMDTRTGKVKRHYPVGTDSNSLKSDAIYYMYRSADGQIYLSTLRGVYTYNKDRDNFSVVKAMPLVWHTCLFKDGNGTLWAGTLWDGIITFNAATGRVAKLLHNPLDPGSIGSDRINCIFCDNRNRIWVGTEGGLCLYNESSHTFTRYTMENGLPSDVVLNILEDDSDNLWISTSRGLVAFSLNNKCVKTYKKENGILSDQFNYNSAFKDKNGRLYFGSLKGLISFDPASLSKATFDPPLYITGFQVNNKELVIGNKNSPLQQSVTWTHHMDLTYKESSFSIDFAALNYAAPEATEYAYKMTGLDTGWTYLKTNRKVYFTNLSPGTYEFKVKASVGDDKWNGAERCLKIRILPPWWQSVPAYLLYFTVVVLSVVMLVHSYNMRVQARNKRKMEQLEIAKTREMYEDKLNFFTNVAHEIKTPLTLIKGPMEKVIRTVGREPEVADSLKIMNRNANRLVELTNQLLDFRQAEIKGFSLNFARVNISEMLQDAYEGFRSLATGSGLRYTIKLPAEPVYAWVDIEAFNKILSNLFTNAIKYAGNTVTVNFVGVEEDSELFIIDFSNDGFLIPHEMAERVFEPFFRLKETRRQGGTGIGLALSLTLAKLHNGMIALKKEDLTMNTFTLKMPTQQHT